MRQELAFPCDGDEEFQDIQCEDAVSDLCRFPLFVGKIRCVGPLQQIEEGILDSRTNRVPCTLRYMGNDPQPYQVSLFDSMDDRGVLRERERE